MLVGLCSVFFTRKERLVERLLGQVVLLYVFKTGTEQLRKNNWIGESAKKRKLRTL